MLFNTKARSYWRLAVLLITCTLIPATGWACVSSKSNRLTDMLDFDLIFSGELVDYEVIDYRHRNQTRQFSTMTFDVIRVFKGEVGETITVYETNISFTEGVNWANSRNLIVSASFRDTTNPNYPYLLDEGLVKENAKLPVVPTVNCSTSLLFPQDPYVEAFLETLLKMERSAADTLYKDTLSANTWLTPRNYPMAENFGAWSSCMRRKLGDCGAWPGRLEPLRVELAERTAEAYLNRK